MAELFENNSRMTIYVGDKELIDYLYQRFDINYNAHALKDYLSDIWSYITSAKIIDNGSFLKNCANAKDVEEKIKFLKDYICAKPPKIWDDFFLDIKQRCYPFVSDSASYIMMKIDSGHENQGLVKLLTTDQKLRSMIVLVEGYRLLVKKEDMSQFKTLMKERGYLI